MYATRSFILLLFMTRIDEGKLWRGCLSSWLECIWVLQTTKEFCKPFAIT